MRNALTNRAEGLKLNSYKRRPKVKQILLQFRNKPNEKHLHFKRLRRTGSQLFLKHRQRLVLKKYSVPYRYHRMMAKACFRPAQVSELMLTSAYLRFASEIADWLLFQGFGNLHVRFHTFFISECSRISIFV